MPVYLPGEEDWGDFFWGNLSQDEMDRRAAMYEAFVARMKSEGLLGESE